MRGAAAPRGGAPAAASITVLKTPAVGTFWAW